MAWINERARARFYAKTEKCWWNGCLYWTGSRTPNGYSRSKAPVGRDTDYGHRIVWEQERGPIPPQMTIDHLCRNRHCVNVNHMDVVTHTENCRRGKGSHPYCKNGHALAGGNLKIITAKRKSGGSRQYRQCVICYKRNYGRSNARARERRAT